MEARKRLLITLLGATALAGMVTLVVRLMDSLGLLKWDTQLWNMLFAAHCIAAVCGGSVCYMFSSRILARIKAIINWLVKRTQDKPLQEIILGTVGAILGLAVGFFMSTLVSELNLGVTGVVINAIIFIILGCTGYAVMGRRWSELETSRVVLRRMQSSQSTLEKSANVPKLLDTSVIVDGRIFDICQTGFIEGPLVVPRFVLEELQHIADSSDSLKRNRGRRGLDMIKRIQTELEVQVTIDETDFDGLNEVDVKLLKLAQQLGGKIVTNDYNLNKVAEVTGVAVLNINELANAVKPVLLPGEELTVQIVREGKEQNQGVAFLDDGTMIVIENGRRCIGQTVCVVVNTVLQTAAGRMIFAKLRERMAV